MDPAHREYYLYSFRNVMRQRLAGAFQDLFWSIMRRRYPGDFLHCKAWGSAGDRSCDGMLLSEGRLFACYAPEVMTAAECVDKIDKDFRGAVAGWRPHCQFRTWTFVHNAERGLPPQAVAKLAELTQSHPGLVAEQWGPTELEAHAFALADQDIIDLLGQPPTPTERNQAVQAATAFWEKTYSRVINDHCRRVSYLGVFLGSQVGQQQLDVSGFELDTLYQPQGLTQWCGVPEATTGPQPSPGKAASMQSTDLLRDTSRAVILGEPGIGKSALLSHIVMTCVRDDTPASAVPVLVELAGYTAQTSTRPCSLLLIEAATQAISAAQDVDVEPLAAASALGSLLEQGKALLLLDGLDEILDLNWRSKVQGQIIAVARAFPQARLYVTCRTLSYTMPLRTEPEPTFEEYELQPLEDANVEAYVRAWSLVRHPEWDPDTVSSKVAAFIQATTRIHSLSGMPLILQLLTGLWELAGQRLPHSEPEVYDAIVRTFAGDWDEYKHGLAPPDRLPTEIQPLLQDLALWITEEALVEPVPEPAVHERIVLYLTSASGDRPARRPEQARRFLEYVATRVWLFTVRDARPHSPTGYGFIHRALREYLAGAEFWEREKSVGGTGRVVQSLRERLSGVFAPASPHGDEWVNVLGLMALRAQTSDPRTHRQVIQGLLAPGAPNRWQAGWWVLYMSARGCDVGDEALVQALQALLLSAASVDRAENSWTLPWYDLRRFAAGQSIWGYVRFRALPEYAHRGLVTDAVRGVWPALNDADRWTVLAVAWQLVRQPLVRGIGWSGGAGGDHAQLYSGGLGTAWRQFGDLVSALPTDYAASLTDMPSAAAAFLLDAPLDVEPVLLVEALSSPGVEEVHATCSVLQRLAEAYSMAIAPVDYCHEIPGEEYDGRAARAWRTRLTGVLARIIHVRFSWPRRAGSGCPRGSQLASRRLCATVPDGVWAVEQPFVGRSAGLQAHCSLGRCLWVSFGVAQTCTLRLGPPVGARAPAATDA